MTSPADVKALRNIYIQNPPEGISPDEIRQMSVDDLLDMDYFLHEDVYIPTSKLHLHGHSAPASRRVRSTLTEAEPVVTKC